MDLSHDTLSLTVTALCRRLDEIAGELCACSQRASLAVGGAAACVLLASAAEKVDQAQRSLADNAILG